MTISNYRPAAYYVTDADGGRYVEPITLRIGTWTDKGHKGHHYFAHFDTEDQALGFLARLSIMDGGCPADAPWTPRENYHTFSETSEYPIPMSASRLLNLLYPTCPHGLSEDLCAGPGHYPMDRPAYM